MKLPWTLRHDKRPNIGIPGIKKEAEAWSKGIEYKFNEVITENSQSLRTSTESHNAIPVFIPKLSTWYDYFRSYVYCSTNHNSKIMELS
jgi:hypothetical protein